MIPKVFISYSWSSQEHQALIKSWAEQLLGDGVEVVLDIYDLKEGHDKYVFMERMVTDKTVTHVLVFSDRQYAEKADSRRAGVGTESQIISKNVYEKVNQSKFIPIVCEIDESGHPYLPTFLESRIWIDFSSPEAANRNWERLVRLLHGKPQDEKPERGSAPLYITSAESTPTSAAGSKFRILRQAILDGKPGINLYREDFVNSCVAFVDAMRIREAPNPDNVGKQIVDDCGKLKLVRNHIVDWVLLEASIRKDDGFTDALIKLFEAILELKARPPELMSYNQSWFGAHSIFGYEVFLYILAALIKCRNFEAVHEIFTTHYLPPREERHGNMPFVTFDAFYGYSDLIHDALSDGKQRYRSAGAELIHRQADRDDVPFSALMEAELVTFLMALLTDGVRWYPGTLHYSRYGADFDLFLRAAQHKHFDNLATITGEKDAEQLRSKVKYAIAELGNDFGFRFDRNFWEAMNMEHMDTIK